MPEPGREDRAAVGAGGGQLLGPTLAALIASQLGLHSAMAGLRMAAPLLALRDGSSALAVGVLMSLFAVAPVMLALQAGRMADRHGFHRPVKWAVSFTLLGVAVAITATLFGGSAHFVALCVAATLAGAGTNIGLISIQRTAGQTAMDSVQRMRVFSWLGMAPSMSNVIGPVLTGFVIDLAGFRAAFAVLLLLPVVTLVAARRVPRRVAATRQAAGSTAWDLLQVPGMKRLLMVNLLLSACWDVHTFAVPVLGHDLDYSASTIGLILGSFTFAVTGVRLLIPIVAHRMREVVVLRVAMVGTGLIFAAYPFAGSPWSMGLLAMCLGVTLGSVQPMIMSGLHHLSPDARQGEAIALRSIVINLSSSVLPLAFGLAGAAVGVAVLFWSVGSATAVGSWPARRLRF